MFSTANPCCMGSFYGTPCTPDCASVRPLLTGANTDAACKYCDGTGDVHGADGEWRGVCTACDAAAWAAYSRAWPEAMAGAPTTGRLPMTALDRDFGE